MCVCKPYYITPEWNIKLDLTSVQLRVSLMRQTLTNWFAHFTILLHGIQSRRQSPSPWTIFLSIPVTTPLLISTIQRVFEIHLQSLVRPTNQPVPLPQLNAQTTVTVMNSKRADGTTQRICPTNPCLNIPIIPLLVHLIPFRFVPNDQITIIILN